MTKTPFAVISNSGGKDSTATALCAREAYGPESCVMLFADTGHEHPETLDYVQNYLPGAIGLRLEIVRADFTRVMSGKRAFIEKNWRAHGVPMDRIARALDLLRPTGNPYLDLCLWKGRFPSRKAQFCTQELKANPLNGYLDGLPDDCAPESWRGIRRDESQARRNAKDRHIDATNAGRPYWVVHPIAAWTAQATVDFVKSHGLLLNPLYSQGMRRVGCMPCINCGKDELLEISKRWPQEIERVREWEALVSEASKRGAASFFSDLEWDGVPGSQKNIYERIEWSKTSYGGVQYDIERAMPFEACSSQYGLCE